jgi:hypothetical protein
LAEALKIRPIMAVSVGMQRRLTLTAAVFTLLSGLFPVGVVEAQSAAPFTASETRRLRRGRLVTRPEEQRRGDLLLVGGTSFRIVDHPPDVVWRAVQDSRAYRYYLPEVHRVSVVSRGTSGRGRVIRVLHKRGPLQAGYHLRLDFAGNVRTAQFRIDSTRDNDIREGWGYVRVQAYGENRSMVTWGILADVGSGLAVGLLRSEIQRWILEVPSLLSNYLGWAADRYER